MTQGFGLITTELETHRRNLTDVSETLSSTGGGAGGLGAPPSAFGIIGEFIPGMLQPLVDEAGQVINAGAESVRETASMVASTVETYHQIDAEAQSGLDKLGGAL